MPGTVSRGLILDGAVFVFNLLLATPLAELVKSSKGFHPLFGLWLFAAIAFYTIGAALKRRPLQARLQEEGRPPLPTGIGILLFVLAVMHCGLFLICSSFALEALMGGEKSAPGGIAMAATLLVGFIPTIMLVRALLPTRRREENARRHAARELAADLFLYLTIIVIMVWWDGFWAAYLAGGKQASLAMNIVLVLLTTVPFSIFYLAPRFLFLLEDWRYPATWVRAFLVMLPLARHILL
ncbi:MAG: hypothetical protein NTV79_12060 [Candidatus Aureabacteria bacterium]|nr:hypothetical protein [Candidatus Auribacterota bacterium]